MSSIDETYIKMLHDINLHGDRREDRTGVGTTGIFGYQIEHDLEFWGFPLLTTKRVHFKSVIEELLWMLSGSTNVQPLQEKGVTIWDEWADHKGDLGPVYGAQWRDFCGMRAINSHADQIRTLLVNLIKDPYSRRHVVSAWCPTDIVYMKLPPCHLMFQLYVRNNRLDLHMYMRSADAFLGVPFNIASYAALIHAICHAVRPKLTVVPGRLVISFGDLHIYSNHQEQVKWQMMREPRHPPELAILPNAELIDPLDRLLALTYEDFELIGYDPHPPIAAPVAV